MYMSKNVFVFGHKRIFLISICRTHVFAFLVCKAALFCQTSQAYTTGRSFFSGKNLSTPRVLLTITNEQQQRLKYNRAQLWHVVHHSIPNHRMLDGSRSETVQLPDCTSPDSPQWEKIADRIGSAPLQFFSSRVAMLCVALMQPHVVRV